MNMKTSELVSAWDGLPEDPCIAYFGGDLVIRGRRIDLSHFRQYTESERLDALNSLVSGKDYLVIAPSACGSFVPISQMEPDLLIAAATSKAKMESLPIIDAEILPVFNEFISLMTDSDPLVASQALEDLQDMVFDQTLRKLSKFQLKYFFYFLDDPSNNLVMVLGNRKIISFDSKKIKALQRQMAGISPTTPKVNKRKPKAKPSSSSESSESPSNSSSDDLSDEEGLIPEGSRTPVLLPPSIPVAVGPSVQLSTSPVPSVAASSNSISTPLGFARDKATAEAALVEAQQNVVALAAVAANFQVAPLLQTSGPALKVPPAPLVPLPAMIQSTPPGYKIPRKAASTAGPAQASTLPTKHSAGPAQASTLPTKHSSKHHSSHGKSARKHKKHSKKSKSGKPKPKRDYPSEESSSSSKSESSSSPPETPKIDEASAQVLCSGCCKYTAQPAFVQTRWLRVPG